LPHVAAPHGARVARRPGTQLVAVAKHEFGDGFRAVKDVTAKRGGARLR